MLYIFHGTDTGTSAKKMIATITAMQKKKPDAAFFRVEDGKLSQDIVNELAGGQGLFESKYIVEIQYPFEKADTKDVFLKNLKEFSESENIFLVLEGKILKAYLHKIEKSAEKLFENNLKDEKKKDNINLFSVAESVARKDKKNGWVGIFQALSSGVTPEEIHGVLWWQFKSIYISKIADSAKDSGMKEFSFNKAKRLGEKYSIDDIGSVLDDLVVMSHEAHLGHIDFSLALEKFALRI